jgi:hypothetical protein
MVALAADDGFDVVFALNIEPRLHLHVTSPAAGVCSRRRNPFCGTRLA